MVYSNECCFFIIQKYVLISNNVFEYVGIIITVETSGKPHSIQSLTNARDVLVFFSFSKQTQ